MSFTNKRITRRYPALPVIAALAILPAAQGEERPLPVLPKAINDLFLQKSATMQNAADALRSDQPAHYLVRLKVLPVSRGALLTEVDSAQAVLR